MIIYQYLKNLFKEANLFGFYNEILKLSARNLFLIIIQKFIESKYLDG